VWDSINAQHGIEAALLKGQRPSAIDEGEGSPIGKPTRGGMSLGMRNASDLAIYAVDPTSSALRKSQ